MYDSHAVYINNNYATKCHKYNSVLPHILHYLCDNTFCKWIKMQSDVCQLYNKYANDVLNISATIILILIIKQKVISNNKYISNSYSNNNTKKISVIVIAQTVRFTKVNSLL